MGPCAPLAWDAAGTGMACVRMLGPSAIPPQAGPAHHAQRRQRPGWDDHHTPAGALCWRLSARPTHMRGWFFSSARWAPNAGRQAPPRAGARHERRLLVVGFRVEPAVAQPAPPQTRTCAINAYGSSVTRVMALLWRITVLPCTAIQMLWMILGVGKA